MSTPGPMCGLCGDTLDVPERHLQTPEGAEQVDCPVNGCGEPMHEVCRRKDGTRVARCIRGHRHRTVRMTLGRPSGGRSEPPPPSSSNPRAFAPRSSSPPPPASEPTVVADPPYNLNDDDF
jgi:hypothetical protein